MLDKRVVMYRGQEYYYMNDHGLTQCLLVDIHVDRAIIVPKQEVCDVAINGQMVLDI